MMKATRAATLAVFVALVVGVLHLRQQGTTNSDGSFDMGSGRMFDTIAPHYDIVNRLMSLGMDLRWRRFMIDRLQLKPNDVMLDLATGTADVAIMAAEEKAGPTVLGIDPSSNMLEVGRQKVASKGLGEKVVLRMGDAQDLHDIGDGTFTKVAISFGIRNVPDRPKALREIRRVTDASPSSDSVVAVMDLHVPSSGVLAGAAAFFIRYVAPLLGRLVTGRADEYAHLQRSIFGFPDPEQWIATMRAAGLHVFEHHALCLGVVHLYVARPADGAAAGDDAGANAAAGDAGMAEGAAGADRTSPKHNS